MQLHQLQRDTPNKKHVQVGRGGTRGKTSGRGTKGQNARAGHRKRPENRDIIKKIPKLRGHGKNRGKSNFLKPLVLPVNLTTLEAVFAAGDTVNPTTLMQMGVISKTRLGTSSVKVLGTGTLTKKMTIEHCSVSASAKSQIEAAGGTVSE